MTENAIDPLHSTQIDRHEVQEVFYSLFSSPEAGQGKRYEQGEKPANFDDGDGKTTNPCESCIFLHELLDHGLAELMKKGEVTDPATDTRSKSEKVENQNKALENKGSEIRTGIDHD